MGQGHKGSARGFLRGIEAEREDVGVEFANPAFEARSLPAFLKKRNYFYVLYTRCERG